MMLRCLVSSSHFLRYQISYFSLRYSILRACFIIYHLVNYYLAHILYPHLQSPVEDHFIRLLRYLLVFLINFQQEHFKKSLHTVLILAHLD